MRAAACKACDRRAFLRENIVNLLEQNRLGDVIEVPDAFNWKQVIITNDFWLCLLQKCTTEKDLKAGRHVHLLMVSYGLGSISYFCDHLIRFYGACGSLTEATCAFHQAPRPTMYTWNAIISVHVNHGKDEKALDLYRKMQHQGIKPGRVTYLNCLKACGGIENIQAGQLLHNQMVAELEQIDNFLGSALVGMYSKCKNLKDAQNVFNGFQECNVVLWGAMIAGYVQSDETTHALELLERMQQQNMEPDGHIFSSLLKSCSTTGGFLQGMILHDKVIKRGLDSDVVLQNTLVDMYSKCGFLEEAQRVFDRLSSKNVISWGALIFGFVEQGRGLLALNLFHDVKQEQKVKPSKAIYSCTLKACGLVNSVDQGMLIHKQILLHDLQDDIIVGNALVDMYIKCSKLDDAYRVFELLPHKDVVSWGTIISGYVQVNDGITALALVRKMQEHNIVPDEVLMACSLRACMIERSLYLACRSVGALGHGRWIHYEVIRAGLEDDAVICGALVDMYTFCESLEEAQSVFASVPSQNEVAWGAIIAGYAQSGKYVQVQNFLQHMQEKGLKPNDVVMTSVLAACSHAGLLKEGFSHFGFSQEQERRGLGPFMYSCMVDLLGRAGCFNQACDLIETMPMVPSTYSWAALLTGSRTYSNSGYGKACFDEFVEFNPIEASSYVMMSDIVAFNWSVDEACKVKSEVSEAS
ncbi:hypothetical protein KP509_30G032300 [Ceratopteris richardii]|uniref:Pentatricopeptide repeat-containing protein n=1 Tax=Ceratopteris richardii TaxID=49495 RepID=A0A8T2R197_CERRI|nr:hypothetical protein KP509_30G032300 [Ceratopteris richardii]